MVISLTKSVFRSHSPDDLKFIARAAPDVGIDEEIAHYYFTQILSGMVCPSFHRAGNQNKPIPLLGLYP